MPHQFNDWCGCVRSTASSIPGLLPVVLRHNANKPRTDTTFPTNTARTDTDPLNTNISLPIASNKQQPGAETYPLANSTGALLAEAKSTVYEDLCVKALLNALVVVNG